MGYYLIFDDNILGLGGPGELDMEVRKRYWTLEEVDDALSTWDEWEIFAYNVRIAPISWTIVNDEIPF